MSHVPDDPTKVPNQKPGAFPDKTKQPGHEKEFEKRGDKRPDPGKPGQQQKQQDRKQPNNDHDKKQH